jgi:hypothetical protein
MGIFRLVSNFIFYVVVLPLSVKRVWLELRIRGQYFGTELLII